jgi:hypothetical protein
VGFLVIGKFLDLGFSAGIFQKYFFIFELKVEISLVLLCKLAGLSVHSQI